MLFDRMFFLSAKSRHFLSRRLIRVWRMPNMREPAAFFMAAGVDANRPCE
jgi:hypothetical protein